MTTVATPANAVNLFVGTPGDPQSASMTILMRTRKWYTDGTEMKTGLTYTVSQDWANNALARGWASDPAGRIPQPMTPVIGPVAIAVQNAYALRGWFGLLAKSATERVTAIVHGMSIMNGTGSNDVTTQNTLGSNTSYMTQSMVAIMGAMLGRVLGGTYSPGAVMLAAPAAGALNAFFAFAGGTTMGVNFGSAGPTGNVPSLTGSSSANAISFTLTSTVANQVVRVFAFVNSGTSVTAEYSLAGGNVQARTPVVLPSDTSAPLPNGTQYWYTYDITIPSASSTPTVVTLFGGTSTTTVLPWAVDLNYQPSTVPGLTFIRGAQGGRALGNCMAAALDNTDVEPASPSNWIGASNAVRRQAQTDSMTTRMGAQLVICSFDINDMTTFDGTYPYGWTLDDHKRHIRNYIAAMAAKSLQVLFILGPMRNPASLSAAVPFSQIDLIEAYKSEIVAAKMAYIDTTAPYRASNAQTTFNNEKYDTSFWLASEAPDYLHPNKVNHAVRGQSLGQAILTAMQGVL